MIDLAEMFGQLSLFARLTMVVAVAVFGLSASYACRPTEHKLALMRPASLAGIFAAISGLLGGWITLLVYVAATPDGHMDTSLVYKGVAESLVTGFVCFGLLAVAWMLVAIGMLRRGRAAVA